MAFALKYIAFNVYILSAFLKLIKTEKEKKQKKTIPIRN